MPPTARDKADHTVHRMIGSKGTLARSELNTGSSEQSEPGCGYHACDNNEREDRAEVAPYRGRIVAIVVVVAYHCSAQSESQRNYKKCRHGLRKRYDAILFRRHEACVDRQQDECRSLDDQVAEAVGEGAPHRSTDDVDQGSDRRNGSIAAPYVCSIDAAAPASRGKPALTSSRT
jgi:hypothetical protein